MTDRDDEIEPAPSCRRCGTAMRPIQYGYPGVKAFEAADRGEIFLGGCMVYDGQPQWRCPGCHPPATPRYASGPYTVAEAYATGGSLPDE